MRFVRGHHGLTEPEENGKEYREVSDQDDPVHPINRMPDPYYVEIVTQVRSLI